MSLSDSHRAVECDAEQSAQVVGFPVKTAVDTDGAQRAVLVASVDTEGLGAPVQVEGRSGRVYCGAGHEFQRGKLWDGVRFHVFAFAFVEHETN